MVIAFALGLVLTLCAGPLGEASAAERTELIVRFDSGATAADRLDARKGARADFERKLPVQGMQLVEVESGQSVAAAERALESADGVLYAEPNATRSVFLRPNDPYFSQLWGLENTGQSIRGGSGTPDADSDVAEAWDAGVAGGTVVAVVDTGVDATHPDLPPGRADRAAAAGPRAGRLEARRAAADPSGRAAAATPQLAGAHAGGPRSRRRGQQPQAEGRRERQ